MDSDIKNLFQRAGAQLSGYKEINRLQENEQAKQRWPLLRDIRIEQIADQRETEEPKPEHSPLFERLEIVAERVAEPEPVSAGIFAVKNETLPEEPVPLKVFSASKAFEAKPLTESPEEVRAESLPETEDIAEEVSHLLSAVLGKHEEEVAVTEQDAFDASDKSRPVSELFRRLSGESVVVNEPSPSFFRKMFGS